MPGAPSRRHAEVAARCQTQVQKLAPLIHPSRQFDLDDVGAESASCLTQVGRARTRQVENAEARQRGGCGTVTHIGMRLCQSVSRWNARPAASSVASANG